MVKEEWFKKNGALIDGPDFVKQVRGMNVVEYEDPKIRRKYSITTDVLAFLRCSRQYGYFAVKNYVPAQATQLYFGIVIHEVLDRAHRQYKGLMEGKSASVPTEKEIKEYFLSVTASLESRGIRPYSMKARETALDYLQRFNSSVGTKLYPLVKDTEHQLKVDMKDYVLHGVVDVIANGTDKLGNDILEIWDYKGSRRVEEGSREMKDYEFQMRIYAELYRQKNGKLPARAILCFLGEGDPDLMKVEVTFDPASIKESMDVFYDTVKTIEDRRQRDDWSPPRIRPSIATCAGCDIRWDCKTVEGQFKLRYP